MVELVVVLVVLAVVLVLVAATCWSGLSLLLLHLDDTRFSSNKGESEADRNSLEARVERLKAEADGRAPDFTDDLKKAAPQVVEDQMALYQTRMQRQHNSQTGRG